MLHKTGNRVLGRTSPCDVPQGDDSVAVLPVALPHGLFEHPVGTALRKKNHYG